MNDTSTGIIFISGIVTLITLIFFFIMTSNISKIKNQTYYIFKILEQYAKRDGILDEKGRIIKKEKQEEK